MINLLYFALIMLYAVAMTHSVSNILTFALSIIFFTLFYRVNKIKSGSKITTLVQMMCYSIPISWRNIFGGSYDSLPISWFYILGTLLIINLLLIKKEIRLKSSLAKISIVIFLILLFSLVPLMIANTDYINQAISQFIIVSFHNIVILVAILKGNIINNDDIIKIEKSYISAGFTASLGIISQFILFSMGFYIGSIQYVYNRQIFYFLFSDASHATLYLATAAFLPTLLLNSDKTISKFKYFSISIIILLGASITSARTGLFVFFAVYIFYVFINQRGFMKKILSLVVMFTSLFGVIMLFQIVRPQENIYDALFNSSGRTIGYDIAIDMFLKKPLLGYGFSRDYIAGVMGTEIPHFSFLQYLVHTGFIYTIMVFGIIFYSFFYARKYKMSESWLILITVIGTCLIPDIFSTRYITLLILIVFLKNINNNQTITSHLK